MFKVRTKDKLNKLLRKYRREGSSIGYMLPIYIEWQWETPTVEEKTSHTGTKDHVGIVAEKTINT